MVKKNLNLKNKLLRHFPLILLYFSVLNEFDIDVPTLGLLSFNLPFIIIFYWSLKDPDHIGNGLIFISDPSFFSFSIFIEKPNQVM